MEATQKLQQQLAGSAEQPAVAATSSDGPDAHDDFPVGEDPFLAELRSRQQKKSDTKRQQDRSIAA